jgi:hypothetical protein
MQSIEQLMLGTGCAVLLFVIGICFKPAELLKWKSGGIL